MAKKPSLFDLVSAAEDVQEELIVVPEWGNVSILFRGMSLAALQVLEGINVKAAQQGNMDQIVRLLQATACDPDTKMPVFGGDVGGNMLRVKNGEVLLRLVNEGALVVLGMDEDETSGKDSSSTETEVPATA